MSRMQTRDPSPPDTSEQKGDETPEGESKAVRKEFPNAHSGITLTGRFLNIVNLFLNSAILSKT
jgi:hypothetical protein